VNAEKARKEESNAPVPVNPQPKKEEPKAAPEPVKVEEKKPEPKAAPAPVQVPAPEKVEEKKSEPQKEEPKAEPTPAPAKVEEKKPEPKKEEPKAAPAPVKVEEKKPEPKKEEPKAAPAKVEAKKPEPKPAPVKVEQKKPEAKKEEVKAVKAVSVPAGEQPPKNQEWRSGELLSTCCGDYYKLVRADDNDMNWVLLKHESNTKVRAEATGSGGLEEILPLLGEKETAFIYIRYTTGDTESKRAKFVFISWCGARAPIMRKAKMSVHKADVKDIFYSSAIEVHATEVDDLDDQAIRASLQRVGGANYNGQGQ